MGPEGSPDPDVIGTAGADRARPHWRRYVLAGGVLALAGIIAATSISSAPQRHTAARRPGGVIASPAGLAPRVPVAVPSQAWVTSLDIANWPMPGSGSDSSMFAGGVAGNGGWELTVRDVARSGQRCAAAVVLGLSAQRHAPRPAIWHSSHSARSRLVRALVFSSLAPRQCGRGLIRTVSADLRSACPS